MSSFNPYTKAVKEAINVDFNTRQSPQKVILCNRQNKFYGEFIGKITATEGMVISSGVFTDVDLSNVTIYDSEGQEIDLRELSKTMRDISAYLQVDLPWVSALAIENSHRIDELSAASGGSSEQIAELSAVLDAEIDARVSADEAIKSTISGLQDAVDTLDGNLDELSAEHDLLRADYDTAFVPTLDSVDPGEHESPDFLVLKDQSGNGDLYALEMVDGMLAAKKIGFTD